MNSVSAIYPSGSSRCTRQPDTQNADTPKPMRFINVDQIICAANERQEMAAAQMQVTAVLTTVTILVKSPMIS